MHRRPTFNQQANTKEVREKEEKPSESFPPWTDSGSRETAEKRKMEEAPALFANQGRVKRFRTKGEHRDNCLRLGIAALEVGRDELKPAERNLAAMVDGVRACVLWMELQRHGLGGIYEPLYRPFETPDLTFSTPGNSTAPANLFHVVVDMDETASRAPDMTKFKEKIGRITFMPLNHLKPNSPIFNAPPAQDALPLMDKVRFGGFPPEDLSVDLLCQFITTAFRSETLVIADKFYGVLFTNQKVGFCFVCDFVVNDCTFVSPLNTIRITILTTLHFIVIATTPCYLFT
ncbi:hypothetical protein BDN67DRAFT_1003602, partial [Paxillus ammoniavirescens]